MVTKVAEGQLPKVGDKVRVAWGVDEVPGTVVEIYGAGILARARVRVAISGSSNEELDTEEFSLPLSAIRPA